MAGVLLLLSKNYGILNTNSIKKGEHDMKIALLIFAILSLLAFILYGADKRRARRGLWRISEKALLLTSFLGGALGGLAAMQLFRHKTRHWYFYAVNLLGLLWQIGLLLYLGLSL